MPRITVYVTEDLKTRMDNAGEGLNWSAIAQDAFRAAIITRDLKKESTNMTTVIERLRASKKRVEEADFALGRQRGAQWAQAFAQYDELQRIWSAVSSGETVGAESLRQLIDPEGCGYDWGPFWAETSFGSHGETFTRGFAQGAADVLEEVKDQL